MVEKAYMPGLCVGLKSSSHKVIIQSQKVCFIYYILHPLIHFILGLYQAFEPKVRTICFGFTVTEREVINGILDVKNTKNHCLAYVRWINNINLQNLKKASLFIDILNRSLDTEAVKLLANLRDERLVQKIEQSNYQRQVQFKWHKERFKYLCVIFV